MVEITPRAEQQLDARLTRRLIGLELGDVEVPARPGEKRPRNYATVYFRVLAMRADALRVELWERGEFHGARSVSGEGSRQLRARRIALGAAELVRRLRQKRLAEARRLAEEEARLARERAQREAWEQEQTVALGSELVAAAVGPGDLWLVGPGLSGDLRFAGGARLDLGVRYLAGAAPHVDDSAATWFELAIAPGYQLRITPAFDLVLGAQVAASAVHLSRAARLDDVDGQHDTWSARAGGFVAASPRLGNGARLSVGPEAGVVLRPVRVDTASGARHELGGLWLGVRLGLALDPTGRL